MTPEAIRTPLAPAALGRAATPLIPALLSGEGRLLYGSADEGVLLSWNEFHGTGPRHSQPKVLGDALEIFLNVAGEGVLRNSVTAWTIGEKAGGCLIPGKRPIQRDWVVDQDHRFLHLTLDRGFLRRTLGSCDGALNPAVEAFIQGTPSSGVWCGHERLTLEHERTIAQVLAPPVPQGARGLWYQSKALQLMIDFLFDRPGDGELFCDRQKRIARERVARVVSLLENDLFEPPSLATIAKRVGCSPFYLSRTFSRETGMSIPQYLRRIRMEKAAELLATGRYNVTEAAMEVGYSSLSHFSQAFCQVIGCCPALYPLQRRGKG